MQTDFPPRRIFGLSVARSLRSQSLCRFATNVLITWDRQGSGGAAPKARGLQGLRIWPNSWLFKWKFQVARLRKFSMHFFNALFIELFYRTLEAMW